MQNLILIEMDSLAATLTQKYCAGCLDGRNVQCHTCTIGQLLNDVYRMPRIESAQEECGEWLFEDSKKISWTTKAICSRCRNVAANNIHISTERSQRAFVKEHRFCHKCGAYMKEK